jgi:hypothetical protein
MKRVPTNGWKKKKGRETNMKTLFGIIIILLAAAIGLYVGVYLMFIKGLIQAIEAAKATPIEATGLAFGVARVIFAAFTGWLSFLLGMLVGVGLIQSDK